MNYYVTMEKDNFWAREFRKRGFSIVSFIECILGRFLLGVHKEDVFFIIASKKTLPLYKVIRMLYPQNTILYWYWDSVDTGYPPHPDTVLRDKNTFVYSFDQRDCKRFNMNYNTQFYCNNFVSDYGSPDGRQVDVFFIGSDKGRYQAIMDIKEQLEAQGITCDFRVVKDKTSTKDENRNYSEGMAYRKVIKRCTESKAIFDYCQEVQSGLSLRAMESLFLSTKLITTNADIEQFDFYNPNNIYIWGSNRTDTIKEFLSTPYEEVDSEIVKGYEFDVWYSRMMRRI